jgi:uncharacterized protein with beta-barrel porin domain
LSGTNSYTGATTIDGGTLNVNGSIVSSNRVSVNNGGTLSGDGSVSNVTVRSGGLLAPGNSIGTLDVKGNLTIKNHGGYLVEVAPKQADRTRVSGTAALDGTLYATLTSGAYKARQYKILTAKGGRTGKFDDIVVLGFDSGFKTSLSYTSTAVFLELEAKLGRGGETRGGNQSAVANTINAYFNNGGALPAPFLGLFALKGGALANGISQVSGEGAASIPTAGFQPMNSFLTAMINPFGGGPSGNVAATGTARGFAAAHALSPEAAAAYAAVTPGGTSLAPGQRWSLWGASYGGSSSIDGNVNGSGAHDVRIGNFGLATGADYRVSPDAVLGLAVAGGRANWNLSQGLGGGHSDAFQLGGYGSYSFGSAYISAAVAFALLDTHTERTVSTGGGGKYEADFNAQNLGGRIEIGNRFNTTVAALIPYVAIQAQNLWLPAYGETTVSGAPAFALTYGERSVQALRTELGTWVEKTFPINGGVMALRGRIAWAHDEISDPSVTARFQSLGGASFTVSGAPQPSDSALLTAATEVRLANNLALGLKLDGEFASNATTYAATAELRKSW